MAGAQIRSPIAAPPPAASMYVSPYAGQTTDQNLAPVMPEFNSIYNPSTMSLGSEMQGMLNGVQYNQQPLQNLQANATSTNASPWAQLQSQLARQQTGQAGSQAANQVAGQTAQTEGNLAQSGGLSSGARERAQEAGQASGIAGQQGIQNQGNQQQLQIGLQDAANKQQEMMALPGLETQAYEANLQPVEMMGQANAQDVAHQMANTQAANQFNMAAYGNQASMYGAGQTANAQQNAALYSGGLLGGGGLLGTGIGAGTPGSWLCSERGKIIAYDQEEKYLLANLMSYARKMDRDLAKWYLRKGQMLVERCKRDENWAEGINAPFIAEVLRLLKSDRIEFAFAFYRKHVYAICHKYWPGCSDSVMADNWSKKEWAA